jgi:hypothetical protein
MNDKLTLRIDAPDAAALAAVARVMQTATGTPFPTRSETVRFALREVASRAQGAT